MTEIQEELSKALEARTAVLGVVGLGYVGLPLAVEMARSGYRTIGFEVKEGVVETINRGESHIQDIGSDVLAAFVGEGLLSATTDLSMLAACDAISICVPTPLSKTKDPDLSYIVAATRAIADALRPGQLIILESTTYPDTTREAMLPVLEAGGLKAGVDFFLCFSPERVDPGNPTWQTKNTPKVLGGVTPACASVGRALYSQIFDTVVPVESAEAAELVKLYENTFRMINIALVNEMAQVCERLGVDVFDVIEAAATKPFGFMRFNPGPGLGGHCIPLDPHYLSWKMRTLSFKTRMIDLASEINAEMPAFVVRKVSDALNGVHRSLNGSRILVLGIAYKRDIDDVRESPALEILRLLEEKGATIQYHDPFCPALASDGHLSLQSLPLYSVPLTAELIRAADCVVIVTDHTDVNYRLVAEWAAVVVDTRGIMQKFDRGDRVLGLSRAVRRPGHGILLQSAG